MRILVTGAAGYIGSTFSYACLEKGYEVIGIDNFINSSPKNVRTLETKFPNNFTFLELDLASKTDQVFTYLNNLTFEVAIHFAGLKAVAESQQEPIKYWENNLFSTINLVKAMNTKNINKLIFSSSATVYGNSNKQPLQETDYISPMSCYGSTKIANEYFLKDVSNSSNLDVISLRYFNPVGAHKEKLIREEIDQTPNNIMPRILRVAKGLDSKLLIYGDDYQTNDGTGERDYIHIEDLVDAHICALKKIQSFKNFNSFNIGTGHKHSVIELLKTFEEINKIKIPYEIVERREGDVPICYADSTKAKELLDWQANRNLAEMCRDAWDAVKNYEP